MYLVDSFEQKFKFYCLKCNVELHLIGNDELGFYFKCSSCQKINVKIKLDKIN